MRLLCCVPPNLIDRLDMTRAEGSVLPDFDSSCGDRQAFNQVQIYVRPKKLCPWLCTEKLRPRHGSARPPAVFWSQQYCSLIGYRQPSQFTVAAANLAIGEIVILPTAPVHPC